MRKPPMASKASGKLILVLLALMLIFNVIIFPSLTAGTTMVPLDLQFAYTPERAYELIESYGDEMRWKYAIGEMTIDVAYPVVYTLFMSIALMLLFPANWKLAWLPYSIFVFDIFENTGIVTLLLNYPNQLNAVAWCTSFFSSVKWVMVLVVTLIILFGLFQKFKSRGQEL